MSRLTSGAAIRQALVCAAAIWVCGAPVHAQSTDRSSAALASGPVKVTVEKPGAVTTPLIAPSQPEAKASPSYLSTNALCPNGVYAAETVMASIAKEARSQGVDERLALAISEQESGFGSNNNSSAGARGPMQLLPGTASDYGVRDICDYGENIRGGVAFLKTLWREFDGNIMLIVAAYNAGQKNVYKAKGIPAFGETVNYVSRVANSYYDYKNALQKSRLNPADTAPAAAVAGDGQVSPIGNNGILPVNGNVAVSGPKTGGWIGGSVLYVNSGNGSR